MSNNEMEQGLESKEAAPGEAASRATDGPRARGRRYGGVAQAERESARRTALIDAATQVFGTVGFRRATVRAVCRLAKLNDRYFYAAFENLEALLQATYAHHAQALLRQLQTTIASSPPTLDARIDAGLHAFFSFLRSAPAARVLLLEVMGVSPQTDLVYQRYIFEFSKLILGMADAPPPAHEEAQAQARIVGLALVGAMTHAGTAWVLAGYQDSEARMVASCRRVLRGALT
ncbi:TetR/AcrR family transcriptional regulator [Pandoraea nosoerga]|uniref:TetR family transcriptional regulator n=1 Tax=Pandoraea nosoerga TaxID=2508296 RepID=A0A5E4X5G8_9BURK|nr:MULTISPECIES: TetR/AcrR family transcriptional regulator [Pandoraea]MBN4665118.1 TetR/AcrR family transcriptional regulator [Pandoraea nosoerga]MBN4675166.1 TetR/AcrR family transcriptional regulator [Pandoraea nosoerga]MBN4680861.1 TetR/AcrR family transcriptional regulator [Pandoraea nosoerga]MBN4744863.1 TetR/AcrR family transcriptional regulator [Pandoraea nosoerga]VVE31482.1 TetR family transcriptional regulator [Pandoraea nosoerga]